MKEYEVILESEDEYKTANFKDLTFSIKYNGDTAIKKVVSVKKNKDDKRITILYQIDRSIEDIDCYFENLYSCYSFGINECKKEYDQEYFDIYGQMANRYEIKDKFNNIIYVVPRTGVIYVVVKGENQIQDYDFFDEIIVNTSKLMETEDYEYER